MKKKPVLQNSFSIKPPSFWVGEAMQTLAKVWKRSSIFLRKRNKDTTKMKT